MALFPVQEGQPDALRTVGSLTLERSLVTEAFPEKTAEDVEQVMVRLAGLAVKIAPPFPPTAALPVKVVEPSIAMEAWEGHTEVTMGPHSCDINRPAPNVAVLF